MFIKNFKIVLIYIMIDFIAFNLYLLSNHSILKLKGNNIEQCLFIFQIRFHIRLLLD